MQLRALLRFVARPPLEKRPAGISDAVYSIKISGMHVLLPVIYHKTTVEYLPRVFYHRLSTTGYCANDDMSVTTGRVDIYQLGF